MQCLKIKEMQVFEIREILYRLLMSQIYLPCLLNYISTQEARIRYLMGLSGLENL